MKDFDFASATEQLKEKYGPSITEKDVLSYALYPKVCGVGVCRIQRFELGDSGIPV